MPPKRKSVKRKASSSSTPVATSTAPPSAGPPAKRQKQVSQFTATPRLSTRTRSGSTRSSSQAQISVVASVQDTVTETGGKGGDTAATAPQSSTVEHPQTHNAASSAAGRSQPRAEQSQVSALPEVSSVPEISEVPPSSANSVAENTQTRSPDLQSGQTSQLSTSDQHSDTIKAVQAIPTAENVQTTPLTQLPLHVQHTTTAENGTSASSTPSKRTPSRRPPVFADAMKREQSAGTSQIETPEGMIQFGGNDTVQREVPHAAPLTTQQQIQIDQQKAQLRDLMLKRMQQDRAQLRAQQAVATASSPKAASLTPISAGKTNVPGRTISSSPFNLHNKAISKTSLPATMTSTTPLVQLPSTADAVGKREREARKEVLLGRLQEIEQEIKVLAEQEEQASKQSLFNPSAVNRISLTGRRFIGRRSTLNGNGTSPNLAQCHTHPAAQTHSKQGPEGDTVTSKSSKAEDPLKAAGWTSSLPMDQTQSSAMARAEAFKQLLEQHRMEISLGLRKDSPYFPARQGVATKIEGASSKSAVSSPAVPAASPSTTSPLFKTSQVGALSPYHQILPSSYPSGYYPDIPGPSSAAITQSMTSPLVPKASTGPLSPHRHQLANDQTTSAILAELDRLTSFVAPPTAGSSDAAILGCMAQHRSSTAALENSHAPATPATLAPPYTSSSVPTRDQVTGSHNSIAEQEPPYNPSTSSAIPGPSAHRTSPYSPATKLLNVKPETPAISQLSTEPLDKGKGKAKRAKKSAEPAEKRLAKKRNKCPVAVAERAERVKAQRIFMVHRERDLANLKETCSVLGSTGNVYTVEFGQVPSCTCPDYFKGNHCKHIIFVALKVMRISETSDLWYQKAYLRSELEEIFANAPVNQFNSAQASASVQKAYREHMGLEPASAEENKKDAVGDDLRDDEGKRKPVEGDECPICADEMIDGGQGANELVYDVGAGGCGKGKSPSFERRRKLCY